MKKKVLALVLTCLMTLSLVSCGESGGSSADDGVYTIGICQLVQHTALDAATQGFKDALVEKLGDKVKFEEGNASGESTNCPTIINGFLASGVDLIMANATPALQAASQATADVPILGTSVTDYASALDISDWSGTVGTNVSGTSDLAPLDQQAAMIAELFPDAKTVGLLYCSAESNSVYQCTVIEEHLKKLGFEVKWFAFTDTNDISAVTQTACDACDVLYIPTDNTAANNTETIANVVVPNGTPVISGEAALCSSCSVASLSISYYDLGYATGLMAYEILVNGADPAAMEIRYAAEFTAMYNPQLCEDMGISVPDHYEAIG